MIYDQPGKSTNVFVPFSVDYWQCTSLLAKSFNFYQTKGRLKKSSYASKSFKENKE
jgi:hypothetical protein